MKATWLLVIGLLIVFAGLFALAEWQGWLQPDAIVHALKMLKEGGSHPATVAIGIAGLLAIDLLLPVPSSIVMIAAGMLLGPWAGTAASFTGAMLSAAIGYCGCRWGGERAFRRLAGERDAAQVRAWLARYGVYAIVISRPVPMLTEVLSCLAGLARMPAGAFFGASAVGTLPVCVVYAVAGHVGAKGALWLTALIAVALPAAAWLAVRLAATGKAADNADNRE